MMDYCDFQVHMFAVHSKPTYVEERVVHVKDAIPYDKTFYTEKRFESFTPGVGLLCDAGPPNTKVATGFYRNSVSDMSFYAGVVYQPLEYRNVHGGLFVGIVTGYKGGAAPLVAPIVSVDLSEKTHLHFTVIPPIGKSPWALGLSFSWRM